MANVATCRPSVQRKRSHMRPRSASFRHVHNTTTGCGFATRALNGGSSFYTDMDTDSTSPGEVVYDQFGQPYVFDGEDWSQVGEQGWVPTVGRIETSHSVLTDDEQTKLAVETLLPQENLFDGFDLDVDMDLPVFSDNGSPNDPYANSPGVRRRSSALFAPHRGALSPVSSPSLLFPTTTASTIPGTVFSTGSPPSYLYTFPAGTSTQVSHNVPKRFIAPAGHKKSSRLQVLDRDGMRAAVQAAAALHRVKAGIANRSSNLEECGYGPCHSRCVHHKHLITLPLNPVHHQRC